LAFSQVVAIIFPKYYNVDVHALVAKGGAYMSWFVLFIAGLLETAWAVGLKYTEGFTKLWPSIGTVIAMAGSFILLSYSLKSLPLGTAYAVWTGIGAVGTVILGMFLFQEPKDLSRILFIGFIIVGIIGLQITSQQG